MTGAASATPPANGRWRLVSAGVIVVVAIVVAIAFLLTSRPTARGIVTRVDTGSLTDVRGFDLRTDAGATLHFEIGQLDLAPPAFNAQHLVVHQATAQPVVVTYEDRNGTLVALRLLDG